jgi:hypothetical protein
MRLLAPYRRHQWGKESVDLVADHAAWYTLEKLTNKSIFETIEGFLAPKQRKLEPTYLLLWSLTATFRRDSRLSYQLTDEERQAGHLVPGSFLRLVPTGRDFDEIERDLIGLLVECGFASQVVLPEELEPSQEANPPEPPTPE